MEIVPMEEKQIMEMRRKKRTKQRDAKSLEANGETRLEVVKENVEIAGVDQVLDEEEKIDNVTSKFRAHAELRE